MNMAYCDYIAHTILRPALQNDGKDQGPLNRPANRRGRYERYEIPYHS